VTYLAKRGSLGVRELQPPFQLRLQDAVFGGQIFVPCQQLLVHRPRDVGQDARPIHNGPFARPDRRLDVIDGPKIVPNRLRCRHTGVDDRLVGRLSFLTLRGEAPPRCIHYFVGTRPGNAGDPRGIFTINGDAGSSIL
jgi:hypothetical protein